MGLMGTPRLGWWGVVLLIMVMQSMMGQTLRHRVQPVQLSVTNGRWVSGSNVMACRERERDRVQLTWGMSYTRLAWEPDESASSCFICSGKCSDRFPADLARVWPIITAIYLSIAQRYVTRFVALNGCSSIVLLNTNYGSDIATIIRGADP